MPQLGDEEFLKKTTTASMDVARHVFRVHGADVPAVASAGRIDQATLRRGARHHRMHDSPAMVERAVR